MQTRNLTRIALFAALTAAMAQIIIPLPFSPVPISLATLAVMLCGGLLPPKQSWWAMAAYLLLGLVGLPVFGGFMGGPGRLFGPTGGYLMAYPFAALAASALLCRTGTKSIRCFAAMSACSMISCFLGGLWLAFSTGCGIKTALLTGVVPFLPTEAAKALLAVVLVQKLRHRLYHNN
ncbi:MAG: biotin transporter BioY [Oscillospiraceae bacterium]|nr:biotin transporter BioY [Oscillospiraceae bacterium]